MAVIGGGAFTADGFTIEVLDAILALLPGGVCLADAKRRVLEPHPP